MSVERITCPRCKQSLAIQSYTPSGTIVVCADCEANVRIVRTPNMQAQLVAEQDTYTANSRPESYG